MLRAETECPIASVRPEKAAPENTVRGAFLRFLLLGGDDDAPVHEKGVILRGAFIEGGIDLESAKDVRSFWFWRCHIAQPINGRNANFDCISLQQCQLGNLNFLSASISGDVLLSGSRVKGETSFEGSGIDGSVRLQGGFEAEGEVRLSGAEIGGQLACNSAKLKNAGGMALICDDVQVKGGVLLQGGFEAEGEVRFVGAEIGGQLACNSAKLKNAGGMALICYCAKVTGSVFLDKGFEADGEVSLIGASVGGDFDCACGIFNNPGSLALACEGMTVTGAVLLRNGFAADGEVNFRKAEIRRDLICTGGTFKNLAAGLQTILNEPLKAANALDLTSARIQGVLWLGPSIAPNEKHAVIQGSITLQNAYAVTFIDQPASWPVATIKAHNNIDLPCYLLLDGFTYERFSGATPTRAKVREKWLMRQRPSHLGKDFRPQPFEQLIKVLRKMGHDADARRIGFLKQSLLRPVQTNRASWYFRLFVWLTGWAWGLSCGYGYRPHRLIVALLALWLGCGFLYQAGAAHGGFAPRDGQVWTSQVYNEACGKNWTECAELKAGGGGKAGEIIAFNAFTYSADMLLPAIDLGQRSAWTPMWREIKVTLPYAGEVTLPPGTLRAAAWAENILGVAGVILIGAILSGIVKRD